MTQTRTTTMRADSAASEARRNLASGTSRVALLAAVFVAVFGTLAVLDTRAIVGVLRGAADFRASGAAVQVLEATGGKVDGARCAALAGASGIGRAGALRPGRPVRALRLPSSDLTVWEVTPGLLSVVVDAGGATGSTVDGRGGIWLSEDLARALGAAPGEVVETSSGNATVAGVYSWRDDGRARTLGYAVLEQVPAEGAFDQCWAQVWPVNDDANGLLYTALQPGAAKDATLGQLNGSLGSRYDTSALLASRVTRPAPLIAAVLGLVLGYAAIRMRRLELASALHARVPRQHLGLQHLIEAGAWLACAIPVAAAAVAFAAETGNPDPAGASWATGMRIVAAGAAGTLLGTLVGVVATRESHLFRYFKDR